MRGTGVAVLCLVLAAAVVFTADCTRRPEPAKKVAEAMMEKALNQGGDSKTKVDLGGSGSVDLSGLPENLRFPGAKALSHVSGMGGESKTETYIMQTDAPIAEVAAHFKSSLAGWKQVHLMEADQMTSMSFESADGSQNVSIMIGRNQQDAKTTMNITLLGK